MSFKCKECGKGEDELRWANGNDLLLAKECFACNFWLEKIRDYNMSSKVVVDGAMYQIGKEDATGMRGFDGKLFNIKFNDGRIIHSTNLWYNGKIPKKFIDRLPNNAIFLKEKFL